VLQYILCISVCVYDVHVCVSIFCAFVYFMCLRVSQTCVFFFSRTCVFLSNFVLYAYVKLCVVCAPSCVTKAHIHTTTHTHKVHTLHTHEHTLHTHTHDHTYTQSAHITHSRTHTTHTHTRTHIHTKCTDYTLTNTHYTHTHTNTHTHKVHTLHILVCRMCVFVTDDMYESCRTYEGVMSHVYKSHVTFMNGSCHIHEGVMAHI